MKKRDGWVLAALTVVFLLGAGRAYGAQALVSLTATIIDGQQASAAQAVTPTTTSSSVSFVAPPLSNQSGGSMTIVGWGAYPARVPMPTQPVPQKGRGRVFPPLSEPLDGVEGSLQEEPLVEDAYQEEPLEEYKSEEDLEPLSIGPVVADLDGDGDEDIIRVNPGMRAGNEALVEVMVRDAEGDLRDEALLRLLGQNGEPFIYFASAIRLEDFSGDGAPDLVLTMGGLERWLRNNGSGTFREVYAENRY